MVIFYGDYCSWDFTMMDRREWGFHHGDFSALELMVIFHGDTKCHWNIDLILMA
jgi:hypothetical protein